MNTQPFDLSAAISTFSRHYALKMEAFDELIKYRINNVVDPAVQRALDASIDTDGGGCCELYYQGSTICVYPHKVYDPYLWDIYVYQDEVLHHSKPKQEPIIFWEAIRSWEVQRHIFLVLDCYLY